MIRLGVRSGLIFFALFLSLSCRQNSKQEITIAWKDSQAVSVSVPESLFGEVITDSTAAHFSVNLENQNGVAILGKKQFTNDHLIFTPAIPFSRGFNYEIFFRDRLIGRLRIPPANTANAPSLVATYPSQNVLPENLLKIYLQFSRPMREGESIKYVALLDRHNDTVSNVFLDLRPELWNEERTALTMWLDPGRIKRELIPNQQMGNPLKKGEQYTLIISREWKDAQGLPLSKSYSRQFTVGSRDSLSPQINEWKFDIPKAGTGDPLTINTGESLDYFLLQETVQVLSSNGRKIPGSFNVSNEETKLMFKPEKPWLAGEYKVQVASHIEDLAGNNLNRVFDRDLSATEVKPEKSTYERVFVINPK